MRRFVFRRRRGGRPGGGGGGGGSSSASVCAQNERTLLYHAVSAGRVDVAEMLLRAKCRVDSPSKTLWTPLMKACAIGHKELVLLLLKAGASPFVVNDHGATCADEAAYAGVGLRVAAQRV